MRYDLTRVRFTVWVREGGEGSWEGAGAETVKGKERGREIGEHMKKTSEKGKGEWE